VMMQPAAAAQKAAEPVKSVRLYMFDCGMIKGFDATFFSLKKEEIAGTTDMVVPCYLVAHPKGTLMWDVGVIPDSVFKGGNGPVSQPLLMATSSVDKPLVPQLAALGYNHGTSPTWRFRTTTVITWRMPTPSQVQPGWYTRRNVRRCSRRSQKVRPHTAR
jgi:hypothetical protein